MAGRYGRCPRPDMQRRHISTAVVLTWVLCWSSITANPPMDQLRPGSAGTTGCPKGYVPPTHQEVEAQFAKWEDEVYETPGGTTRTGRFCRVFNHMCIDQVSNSACTARCTMVFSLVRSKHAHVPALPAHAKNATWVHVIMMTVRHVTSNVF